MTVAPEAMPQHIKQALADVLIMWEDHLMKQLGLSRAEAKFQLGMALTGTGASTMQQAYMIEKAGSVKK